MTSSLNDIVEHYGIKHQLKKFNEEVFELNEAVTTVTAISDYGGENTIFDYKHIIEEIADVLVLLRQIQLYYDIDDEAIKEIMEQKVDRQINRIKESD